MIKKIISFFDPVQKRETLKFCRLSDATFYDRITTIYQVIKSFLDKINV